MLENTGEDMSVEDVAASLIVRPKETKPVEKPAAKVEQAPQEEEEATNETALEDVQSDESVSEEQPDEETSDESSEDQEAADEEDVDVDELEIDVTVDGEEKKVKLKDLKANYSGNGAIEKRLQEASEARNHAREASQKLYVALQEQAVRLAKLDEIVAKSAEPEINWEELKRTNLPKYLLERDKQRETEIRRNQIAQENARIKEEQAKLEAAAREQYTAEQARQLVAKLPEFADPEKAQITYTKLTKTAQAYGYSPEEFTSVLDHRAMVVLNDAMKYREMMSKQAKVQKKTVEPSALLRPGTSKATQPSTQAKKLRDALVKKARATGKAEDVAATLLIRKK